MGGDIGVERPVRFEPLPASVPVVEPVVAPRPEPVPAGVSA